MRWWRRRKQPVSGPGRYYADTVEGSSCVLDKKDNGAIYEVFRVKSEVVALEYLRGRDVRQEGHYVIVETPQRNLGRDMVMIFDERDGAPIEIPERTRLPELKPSPTHCARCGYPVLPAELPEHPTDSDPLTIVEIAQGLEYAVLKGMGYRCTSCGSAACAACYQSAGDPTETTADGSHWHRCWVCRSPVTAFIE